MRFPLPRRAVSQFYPLLLNVTSSDTFGLVTPLWVSFISFVMTWNYFSYMSTFNLSLWNVSSARRQDASPSYLYSQHLASTDMWKVCSKSCQMSE